MLATNGHGRGPKPANRAPAQPEIHHRVVFQHTAGNGRGKVGREHFDLIIADETGHVQRMNTAIGKLPRHTRHRRIIAPADTRIVRIGRIAVMSVAEVRDHQPDLAQFACTYHRTRLPNHGIGGIAVVHGADFTGPLCNAHNLFALVHLHGHGLFTQHVEARLKERFGDLKMGRIGRGHRDQINAVGTVLFACQQFLPIAIGTVRADAQALRIIPTSIGPVIQGARSEFKQAVGLRAQAVCGSDLAALAAPDHAPFQLCHDVSFFRNQWIAGIPGWPARLPKGCLAWTDHSLARPCTIPRTLHPASVGGRRENQHRPAPGYRRCPARRRCRNRCAWRRHLPLQQGLYL
mmetsp:Transcript_7399/g.12464  ORF Transcript_7399/g.12464 Transcript_7399/m.12464 type:complete len:348 (-) Transcript_7399:1816-2859(-)